MTAIRLFTGPFPGEVEGTSVMDPRGVWGLPPSVGSAPHCVAHLAGPVFLPPSLFLFLCLLPVP